MNTRPPDPARTPVIKRGRRLLGILACLVILGGARADSLWERRDPGFCNFFEDTRARKVGDLVTILIRENTVFDGKDDRQMNKQTQTNALLNFKGNFNQNKTILGGDLEGTANSQRQFDGKADYKSDRTLTDRMTVAVTAVLPNGNLVIEGFRKRVVANEERVIHVSGIVRPIDIGAGNIVQSQFIGNFQVIYQGRGQESSYINNGWLGKVVNSLWPF